MSIHADIEKRDAFLRDPSSEVQRRSLFLKREAINEEARTVEVAFSSEEPVERWWGIEILDHSPKSVDLSRLEDGGPGLVDHDPRDHVATIEECRIDSDRVGRATLRFGRSQRAEEIFRDVVDGIRKCISVGYRIHKVEIDDPESENPTYRATLWEPHEISFVSIPADVNVGVGRSAQQPNIQPPATPAAPVSVTRNASMADDTQTIDPKVHEDRGAAVQMEKVRSIIALGEQYAAHGGKAIADLAIKEGKDERWVKDEIMSSMVARANASPIDPDLGLTEKETARFSVMRLIRAMTLAHMGERNAWDGAGFERECHEALSKRHGGPSNGGYFVPYEVQKRQMFGKRDLSVAGNAGYLVSTENQPGSFIELLRAQSVLGRAGARMLPGLKGDIQIPKQTGASTGYWVGAEDDEINESNMTIGQLGMSPRTVGAYTEVSRLLQMQSDPSIDALVMEDFAKVLALKIDLAGLNGNGAGAPVGIVNTSGIGSVTGTSFAYAAAVEFQTDVAGSNALVPGCAYITTPAKAGILKAKQRFTSTDTPIWQGNVLEGEIEGFKAFTTTQLSDGMIFGDFSQLIIGEWGVLEIAVDPTANFKAGITGIRAFQSVDIGIRNAAAFTYASSITA
ncbi:MAG: phage major capsid protein [Pseudomonadota bacterium]